MTNRELHHLRALRRDLHGLAELSGEERATAARLHEELAATELHQKLGGYGLAACLSGKEPGPTVLLRADMDALPIDEGASLPYASRTRGTAHKCGHDGHMTLLVGVFRRFLTDPPARGRLVALFQPAEETGTGARAVIEDTAFQVIQPDIALAVHNLPGFPLGDVVVKADTFACASRGLAARFTGATSHAAEPERGRSPALAVAQVIQAWSAARQVYTSLHASVQATVVHASVGTQAFGTSPGEGAVMATLRAPTDKAMSDLGARLEQVARGIAHAHELEVSFEEHEPFPATCNDPEVIAVVERTAHALGFSTTKPTHPFAWSEDFGHFGRVAQAALVGLGAGNEHPALHNPSYDFPDDLIPIGVKLLESTARHWLGPDD